jgi:hypothetical protein
MESKNVIGISGVARAGKDTFAAILSTKLTQAGHTVLKIALADALKAHCDGFCQEYLGVSAFTQKPEEKNLIRPLLVWYGDAQRKRSAGRYWINQVQRIIDATYYDYYIITDVRYAHYEKDEAYWLQEENKGLICHVSKYEVLLDGIWDDASRCFIPNTQGFKKFVPPANDHEALNDPKVKQLANYIVEWPHVALTPDENLLDNPTLNCYVEEFMPFQYRHFRTLDLRPSPENPPALSPVP